LLQVKLFVLTIEGGRLFGARNAKVINRKRNGKGFCLKGRRNPKKPNPKKNQPPPPRGERHKKYLRCPNSFLLEDARRC